MQLKFSLAQVKGRGSAGQYPAHHDAITPAARERVSHVVAAVGIDGDISARASAQRPTREAIV